MIETDVSIEPLWPRADWQAVCDKAVHAALNGSPYAALLETQATVSISIAFADNAQVHKLNRDYRDKNKPTNILSFPMMEVEVLTNLTQSRHPRAGEDPSPTVNVPTGKSVKIKGQVLDPRLRGGDEFCDDGEILLGDMILAYETCAVEAAEKCISLPQHVTHLIIHGTLHLLGFDHIDDAEAEHMEALEVKALASLGLPNPYSD